MQRQFANRLNGLFSRMSKRRVIVLVTLLTMLFGLLDYWVGYEVSLSFFYLMPIGIATWYFGGRIGYGSALICVVVWDISNRFSGQVHTSELVRYWNMGIRMASYSAFVLLLSELKLALQFERLLARTDHLTGIFNGREFIEQLKFEIQRAERLQYPVSLAYVDLDNFKKVNDEHGHSMGDQHLQLIAHTISAVIRKTDLFARLGGDEFGLFLPNVDQTNARFVLGKIEDAVMRELKEIESPVTLSIGVVTFKSPPATVDDMIRKADALMYQAKLMGKHQTVYFEVE